jgi:rare lipoprotein A
MDSLSAAHPTLPLPVYARVTNLNNGRTIVVRINDRGPYARDRIIDLSRRSAELLGFRENGTARVRVQYLRPAPLNGDDSYERRYAASMPWTRMASSNEFRAKDPVAVGSLDDGGLGAAVPPPQKAAVTRPRSDQVLGPADDPGGPGASLAEEEDLQSQAPPRQRQSSRPPRNAIPVRTVPIQPPPMQVPAVPQTENILIQAGSFKSRDNADRAKALLGAIATVEVAPVEANGATLFRVRVGPFADRGEATAALTKVNEAGYAGARIVTN